MEHTILASDLDFRTKVLSLHGNMSAHDRSHVADVLAEQQFAQTGDVIIIPATDGVAGSSLTLHITCVIDSNRIAVLDHDGFLKIEPVSDEVHKQRRGRTGRLCHGWVARLPFMDKPRVPTLNSIH